MYVGSRPPHVGSRPPHVGSRPPHVGSRPPQVLSTFEIAILWSIDAVVGGWAERATSPLSVGLPISLTGDVRIRMDPQTGYANELWVKAIAINGTPLLPAVLSRWVQASAGGAPTKRSTDVGGIMSALLPWLSN